MAYRMFLSADARLAMVQKVHMLQRICIMKQFFSATGGLSRHLPFGIGDMIRSIGHTAKVWSAQLRPLLLFARGRVGQQILWFKPGRTNELQAVQPEFRQDPQGCESVLQAA